MTTKTRLNVSLFSMLVLVCLFRRRWFGTKFAVPDFAAGISDVATGPQGHCAGKDHQNHKWCRRLWPFYRRCDCDRAQDRQRVKDPDEILGAILMCIEPAFSIFISHRQNAIVCLLAKFINWPCGERTDEYQH